MSVTETHGGGMPETFRAKEKRNQTEINIHNKFKRYKKDSKSG